MTLLMKSKRLRGLHVMATINALCLSTLPAFLTMLLTWKSQYGSDFPNFTLNILRFPSFQSPLVLPGDIRMKHKQSLEGWLANYRNHSQLHHHEINHVQRLIDYLDVVKTPHSDAFDMPKLHNDFKKFYEQYDRRRSKDFAQTFPGLKEWYDSIQV